MDDYAPTLGERLRRLGMSIYYRIRIRLGIGVVFVPDATQIFYRCAGWYELGGKIIAWVHYDEDDKPFLWF